MLIPRNWTLDTILLTVHLAGVVTGGCNGDKETESILDSDTLLNSDTGTQDDEDGGGQCEDPGDAASDTDVDSDTATDIDIDSGIDGSIDSGSDSGTDTDTDTDTMIAGKCPDDMTYIPANSTIGVAHSFCIDRYEASRRDATATSSGADDSMACSKSGVLPWYENPMTSQAFGQFEDACGKAGKRMCELEEWFGACTGEEITDFVYGDVFDIEICNCVDTYCDDYCEENGIPAAQCNTASNCGYSCGHTDQNITCFRIAPTGTFPGCTNGFSTYDMSGNLWEVVRSVSDSRGYEVRGGAFNCAGPSTRLRCEYNADWNTLFAGFRCCRDPVE